MGLTKDYLRFAPAAVCNVVGSSNGVVQCVDDLVCAVSACENVNFFNMRTLEKIYQIMGETKTVTTFKLNGDSSLTAIGYSDGEVHLHRRSQEKDVAKFAGHRTGVNCLAFSKDGLVLASGGKDSMIILWDIVGEAGLFKLIGHKGSITQLQFTQDNNFLLSSSKDFQIKFWSMDSQSCFYTLAENVSEIYTFSLLKSDRLLVVGSAEPELLVFELSWLQSGIDEDDENTMIPTDGTECDTNKKSRNDPLILVGGNFIRDEISQNNTILRCKKRGALIRQAKGCALQLCLSSDDSVLCCLGGDTLVDVYRVFTKDESQKRFHKKLRKEKRKIENQDNVDVSVLSEPNVAKDVTLLITRIGDYRAQAKVKWIDFTKQVNFLSEINVFEYRFYCLLNNNDVHGVSLKVNKKSNEISGDSIVNLGGRGHRSDVLSLSISSTGASFLSGANESAIVWDMDTLLPKNHFFHEPMKQVTSSLFTPGDTEIILCTKNGCIFLFNLASCELMEELIHVHEEKAIWDSVSFPDKSGFITCGSDKKAKLWNYEFVSDFGKKRLSIKVNRMLELPDEALCVAVSQNSKFLAVGLLDNTARIYYLDSLKFFVSLYGHSLPVFCIDISIDSKLVITGSGDKTVKIWGSDFGDCHKSLYAHDDQVVAVKFVNSMEETLFWSAGRDGKIKQWDAKKFVRIQTLEGHSAEIKALTTTIDGSTLISASHDKSIRIWNLTDEIIVLQDEEEREREQQYDDKLVEAEDIVPGEAVNKEVDLAPVKSLESIKSSERILECIDLLREQLLKSENDPKHTFHLLLDKYVSNGESLDFFVLDVLKSVRSSHLEKSLLMVPLSYVPDILKSLCKCVKFHRGLELACRVILFLIRIHQNQILNSVELLPVVDELRKVLPKEISELIDQIGFNVAALRFLQMQIEERENVKLFRDISLVQNEKLKKKKQKSRKVKTIALVRQ